MEDDFLEACELWKQEYEKPKPIAPKPIITKKSIDLTDTQKRYIIEYYLNGADKGLFESDEEGIFSNVEELYDSYMEEANNFIDQVKQHLLDTI